jgi:hypothetical protein
MNSLKHRIFIVLILSLVNIGGFVLLLSQLTIFGDGDVFIAGIALLIFPTTYAIFAWLYTKRWVSAIVIAVTSFVGGLVFGYGIYNGLMANLYSTLFPQANFGLSASFSGFWILLCQLALLVGIVEGKRDLFRIWGVLIAILGSIGFMTAVELITAGVGQSSELSLIRLAILFPGIWILCIVGSDLVSFRKKSTNHIQM